MPDDLLEVSELSVSYAGVRALDGVSLSVGHGAAVSLLGPNGAGKSTLLRAISGLLRFHNGRVTNGRIRVAGRDVTNADATSLVRLGVVQVLEGRHVFAELSVDDNLAAGAFSAPDRSRVATVRESVLELFPILGERSKQPAGLLSGGEQQMLAIGRALMAQPRLMMLDEPSLGLAPKIVQAISHALQNINSSGVGLLVVEQSSALATATTETAYLLDTGTIKATGPTGDLLADDSVRSVYLGLQAP